MLNASPIIQTLIVSISCFLTIVAALPYIVDVLELRTKPRVISWFTWAALMVIGGLASFSQHQVPAAFYSMSCAIECVIIVVLGLRYGDNQFGLLDVICLLGAACGLIMLVIIKSPELAVSIAVITDFIGALPTIKHAWFQPAEEVWGTYALYAVGSGLALLAADFRIFTAVAYLLYLLVIDSAFALIILLSPYNRRGSGPVIFTPGQQNDRSGQSPKSPPDQHTV